MKACHVAWFTHVMPFWMDTLVKTWRIHRTVAPESQTLLDSKSPVIFAFWHGRMYSIMCSIPKDQTAVLISPSSDGEMILQAISRLGFSKFIRGSHKRQGTQAVRGILKALKKDKNSIAFMVDGPQGPRYQVKEGIIRLAAQAKVPIVPIIPASRHIMLKFPSWDQFNIPCYFTKMRIHFGEPYYVPPDLADDAEAEHHRSKLEETMIRLMQECDTVYGKTEPL